MTILFSAAVLKKTRTRYFNCALPYDILSVDAIEINGLTILSLCSTSKCQNILIRCLLFPKYLLSDSTGCLMSIFGIV